jgi:hypothetical protein
MTTSKANPTVLDLQFLRACATGAVGSTGTLVVAATEVPTVRTSVQSSTQTMRASFDPVSAERSLRTKAMNLDARAGFSRPKVSTR